LPRVQSAENKIDILRKPKANRRPSDVEVFRGGFFDDSWIWSAAGMIGLEFALLPPFPSIATCC